jgi:hypothetical protein
MSQKTQSHYDIKRKQDVVSDVFGKKRPPEDLKEAFCPRPWRTISDHKAPELLLREDGQGLKADSRVFRRISLLVPCQWTQRHRHHVTAFAP